MFEVSVMHWLVMDKNVSQNFLTADEANYATFILWNLFRNRRPSKTTINFDHRKGKQYIQSLKFFDHFNRCFNSCLIHFLNSQKIVMKQNNTANVCKGVGSNSVLQSKFSFSVKLIFEIRYFNCEWQTHSNSLMFSILF